MEGGELGNLFICKLLLGTFLTKGGVGAIKLTKGGGYSKNRI